MLEVVQRDSKLGEHLDGFSDEYEEAEPYEHEVDFTCPDCGCEMHAWLHEFGAQGSYVNVACEYCGRATDFIV